MILAGDIGGTKTNLALFEVGAGGLRRARGASLRSADYGSLAEALRAFLGATPEPVEAAAFGIAGPVAHNRTRTPNLAWDEVDGDALSRALGLGPVALLNDLVATALGVAMLPLSALVTLQEGEEDASAAHAVIAAGTGLGMTALLPSPAGPVPMPSEGGHVDFAPRDAREIRLLLHLRAEIGGRVSVERVVSGPGIMSIYLFLREVERLPEDPRIRAELDAIPPERQGEHAAAVIAANASMDALCAEAMRMFFSAYGAVAGNLALVTLARGGLTVAGGVAARNLELLRAGPFLESFLDKGRYRPILERVPLRVALDLETALLGAARHAATLRARRD